MCTQESTHTVMNTLLDSHPDLPADASLTSGLLDSGALVPDPQKKTKLGCVVVVILFCFLKRIKT